MPSSHIHVPQPPPSTQERFTVSRLISENMLNQWNSQVRWSSGSLGWKLWGFLGMGVSQELPQYCRVCGTSKIETLRLFFFFFFLLHLYTWQCSLLTVGLTLRDIPGRCGITYRVLGIEPRSYTWKVSSITIILAFFGPKDVFFPPPQNWNSWILQSLLSSLKTYFFEHHCCHGVCSYDVIFLPSSQ